MTLLSQIESIRNELVPYRLKLLGYSISVDSDEKKNVRDLSDIVCALIDTANFLIKKGEGYLLNNSQDVNSFLFQYKNLRTAYSLLWKLDSDNA